MQVRFSGIALAYNVSVVAFSGFAALFASTVILVTGSAASPAWYVIGCSLVTLVASLVQYRSWRAAHAQASLKHSG